MASRVTPPNSSVYTGTRRGGARSPATGWRTLGLEKIRGELTESRYGGRTEGTHSGGVIGSDFEATVVAQTPLGRIGQPGDIGPIAVFLASDESGWLTGEQILASGEPASV